MAVSAIKKKIFNGMSERSAKTKLKEILAAKEPSINLNRINKVCTKQVGISLLAICEMWHRLRSQNASVEAMIQAFASTVAAKNELNHQLSVNIHNQREELAKRIREIAALKERLTNSKHEICGQLDPEAPKFGDVLSRQERT